MPQSNKAPIGREELRWSCACILRASMGGAVEDDAGHVLFGVRDREVGIGQGGSRACDIEERVS